MRRWSVDIPPRWNRHEVLALLRFPCVAGSIRSLKSVLSMVLAYTLFSKTSIIPSYFVNKLLQTKSSAIQTPASNANLCTNQLSCKCKYAQRCIPRYPSPLNTFAIAPLIQNHRPPPQQHPSTPLPSTQPSTPPTPAPSQDFHCHHFHPSASSPPPFSP